ncbi:efflux RND transporter periplasmic adaptor subunit [Mesorhizobium sp. YR577]|uniref:efflux RND transporter periplasmic adaptor subunit n=1 Tax=Mesorhizobium sp. YR577 TaxID=1884373 RepID=UPI0008F1A26E|nr:efflux RND transporter periplasmic adaptor subunit [Mesorhizobium sp. YR577]SFU17142.1 RND family efflux transporter, MFP subunit [Mesorhizobium sp. YR577]
MATKWPLRLTKAGIILGSCGLAIMYLGPARGTVDVNERVKGIVEATSVVQGSKPLQLNHAEITNVAITSMVERLRVSGELQPINRVVMRAKTAGKIVELGVREGHPVKAGEILVRFETDDLQSTLLQRESDRDAAEAELMLAMQALNRFEQLAAKNVSSKEQLERAKSDVASNISKVRSLSAQVDIARVNLRDAEVLAPFDGIVAGRAVEAGSRVSADAELLTVVDTSALEAKVLVSTRDIPRVAVGQTTELQIDGMEGQTISGKVARINPVAESGTRFVPVYLQLLIPDRRLWGGMFATGSILVREKADALMVPAISVRKDEIGDYVLKLKDGYLQRQPVTVGPAWNGGSLIQIAAGLTDGDTIVIVPLPELQPNLAVTVTGEG